MWNPWNNNIFYSGHSGSMSGSHVRQHWNLKAAQFSSTSAKNRFPSSWSLFLLKFTGCQTLHTQWFPLFSCVGDTIHVPSVPSPAVLSGKCLIAKRYMCAAKSFEAIVVAQLADSPNATCVRPARFRQSRLLTTRPSGPVEGCQTLHTYCCVRFRYVFTKRFKIK